MKSAALILGLLALAACEARPPATTDSVNETAPAPGNTAEPPLPSSDAGGPATNDMPPFAEVNNAHPTAPEAAPIPAAFRGIWAESRALCGNLAHPSRLVISGRTLRFYESVVTESRVERLGEREINVVGTTAGEGTTRPAEYHFSLNAAGDTLTDEAGGGMVRRRCG